MNDFPGIDIDAIHMRRAAKVDGNQTGIVDGLRAAGISVYVTSAMSKGFPDLVAGIGGRTFLFEVKDPKQPRSARKLKPDQVVFRDSWKGHYAVIETLEEALKEIYETR